MIDILYNKIKNELFMLKKEYGFENEDYVCIRASIKEWDMLLEFIQKAKNENN